MYSPMFDGEISMVKEAKSYRKQARKSERMAHLTSHAALADELLNLAAAFRSQAAVLKASKKKPKKIPKEDAKSKAQKKIVRKTVRKHR